MILSLIFCVISAREIRSNVSSLGINVGIPDIDHTEKGPPVITEDEKGPPEIDVTDKGDPIVEVTKPGMLSALFSIFM